MFLMRCMKESHHIQPVKVSLFFMRHLLSLIGGLTLSEKIIKSNFPMLTLSRMSVIPHSRADLPRWSHTRRSIWRECIPPPASRQFHISLSTKCKRQTVFEWWTFYFIFFYSFFNLYNSYYNQVRYSSVYLKFDRTEMIGSTRYANQPDVQTKVFYNVIHYGKCARKFHILLTNNKNRKNVIINILFLTQFTRNAHRCSPLAQ